MNKSIMTISIITLSIMIPSIKTFGIMGLIVTLSITIQKESVADAVLHLSPFG